MHRIRFRTKVEIFGAVLFITLLVAVSAASVTRTITDSSDNLYTFIRNSNGNYWDATGANLQSAIDDLTSGGTVWLPSGTLAITTQLQMEDNVAVIGQGEGKTTIYSDQSGAFIPIWVYQDDHVVLRDFTIDMNSKGSNGIYVGDSDYVTIDHVEILNAGFQGIYISPYGTDHSFFTNIRVKHGLNTASHGIGVNNANNSIFSNILVENYDTDNDISEDGLDITDCYNSTFDNINVQGCGWHDGIKLTAGGPALSNCTFSNIIISDAVNYGMKIQNTEYSNFNNIVLRDTGYISIWDGADLVHHCNFNNIIISNSDSMGLHVGGQYLTFNNMQIINPSGSGIRIENNAHDLSFSNLYIMHPGNYNYIGSGCTRLNFVNCEFTDGSSYGFSIQGSSHFKFLNCLFKDNTGDGIDTTASACNNYSIIGCTFMNNALGIDCNSNDDYIMITLNSFIGDTLDDHYTTGLVENNIGDDI